MLSAIVRAAASRPVIVLIGAGILFALGVVTLMRARYDVFPEFVPPQASVQTEAPGLTPEQVERFVTRPLEQALMGANGVESVRSESIQGLSVITVVFEDDVDPQRARQVVSEQLAQSAGVLPPDVSTPKLSPLTSSTMDLLKIGFVSSQLDPRALRELVEWTVRPRLLAVPGVARATLFGGEVTRIEVRLRWPDLFARDLSLEDIAAAIRSATAVRGGGFVDTAAQRIVVAPSTDALTAAELAQLGIAPEAGPSVRLADVADVVEAGAPRFGDALIQGKEGVLLALSSQYGANTLETTRSVERALAEIAPAIEARGVEIYPALHRPANFIETALAGIRTDLLLGAVLIAFVLYGFVRDIRVAVISFASIPLALLAALIVLDRSGQTINTMTLGGLAVALGVVIDDAIVDVENVTRRLHGLVDTSAKRLQQAVVDACVEVRKPIVAATSVLSLTILPVLLLHGLQGAFFVPLALAFLLSIAASLAVALTVTPALSVLLLRRHLPHVEPAFLLALKRAHRHILAGIIDRPRTALVSVLVVGLATLGLFAAFDAELLPAFRERHYVLQVNGPAGASIEAMEHVGASIIERLLAIDGVATVEQQVGRAEAGEDTWPPNRSEFHVELEAVDGAAEERVLRRIRDVLDGYPGFQTEALTFLGDRIGESLSGETAAVAVGVYGPDLDVDDAVAERVATVLRTLPGAADVQVKAQAGAPQLRVSLDADDLARAQVPVGAALDAIEATFQGLVVARVPSAERVTDIVIADAEARSSPETLGDVRVRNAAGGWVRLADVARVELAVARASIVHEGGRRRQMVTANPESSDVAAFVAQAKRRTERDVQLPAGVHLEWRGVAEGRVAAAQELGVNATVALVAILVVLSLAFGGWRVGAIVLSSAPFAAAGGALAVLASGGVLSLGALVGFVTLFGITARNAILLISHADHLVESEGYPWSASTLMLATEQRLRPILMTALVAGLALIPLALQSGEAGREVQGPMARVIVGGLSSSLLMGLFLLPVLVLAFRRSHNFQPAMPSFARGVPTEGPAD